MDDTRTEAPMPATDERVLLTGFIDFQRDTLRWKCQGLPDEQLRSRSVPTANVTLLGLLRHMAQVERFWFREVWNGEHFAAELFSRTDDRDEDWNDLAADTGPAALTRLQAEIELARENVAATDLTGGSSIDVDFETEAVMNAEDVAERSSALRLLNVS